MTDDAGQSDTASTNVDVHLNGTLNATTANEGAYTWSSNYVGGGSHTFQVLRSRHGHVLGRRDRGVLTQIPREAAARPLTAAV